MSCLHNNNMCNVFQLLLAHFPSGFAVKAIHSTWNFNILNWQRLRHISGLFEVLSTISANRATNLLSKASKTLFCNIWSTRNSAWPTFALVTKITLIEYGQPFPMCYNDSIIPLSAEWHFLYNCLHHRYKYDSVILGVSC